eukprot:1127346-Amphidinium_carterae.3
MQGNESKAATSERESTVSLPATLRPLLRCVMAQGFSIEVRNMSIHRMVHCRAGSSQLRALQGKGQVEVSQARGFP